METAEAVWTQPLVYQGQEVLFYAKGQRNDSDAHRAIVLRVWPDFGVQLRVVSGSIVTTHTQKVRHVDDPFFDDHPNAKQCDGAWDLTPWVKFLERQHKVAADLIVELSERLESLEAVVSGLQDSAPKGKSK